MYQKKNFTLKNFIHKDEEQENNKTRENLSNLLKGDLQFCGVQCDEDGKRNRP